MSALCPTAIRIGLQSMVYVQVPSLSHVPLQVHPYVKQLSGGGGGIGGGWYIPFGLFRTSLSSQIVMTLVAHPPLLFVPPEGFAEVAGPQCDIMSPHCDWSSRPNPCPDSCVPIACKALPKL